MKKYLLLTLGMLAAVPSLHAITADDLCNKLVGVQLWGSNMYNGYSSYNSSTGIVKWPSTHELANGMVSSFEKNGADDKVILKGVDFGDGKTYDLNFTIINGETLQLDPDPTSSSGRQIITCGNYESQLKTFQEYGLPYNYGSAYRPNMIPSLFYVPKNTPYVSDAFDYSGVSINIKFTASCLGYIPNYSAGDMSKMLTFAQMWLTVYEPNAKMQICQNGEWSSLEESGDCLVHNPGVADADGFTFRVYNWMDEGFAFPNGCVRGTLDQTNKTINVPKQIYNGKTTPTPRYYNIVTYSGMTGFMYKYTANITEQAWYTGKFVFDSNGYIDDFTDLPGTYENGVVHGATTDDLSTYWDTNSDGKLASHKYFSATFPNPAYWTNDYENLLSCDTIRFIATGTDVTLSAENTLQRYAFHGDRADLQQFGLYVGGKFKLTNAQYYDHMELYVVPEKTRSITGKTLDADKGLANAINITDEITWFQWPSTDLGALPNTWGHTHHGATDEYLDPANWTQEDRDYVNTKLLAAPDANGYVYYNHLVTPARLGWTSGSNSPAKRVNAASIPGYSVFAKVYYTAASGLQPTFHGLQYLDNATTSIEDLETGQPSEPVTVLGHYDVAGRAIDSATPGIHIVRMSDGSSRKEIVR